ncbi:MAG: PAS domain S-box protein, partial [Candidatus Paceibacterales bacterium]
MKLKVLAKEKEDVRRKLVVTAQQLAKIAKEKEVIRRKLAAVAETLRLKAKQLAVIAREKESVRQKLAVVAAKLQLKAEELAFSTVKNKAILASIGDAVMACDKDGRVILFNRKAVEITGFSAKQVIGRHYNRAVTFVRETDNKRIEDFIAKALKTGNKTTMAENALLVRKNGTKVPVADSAEPIRYAGGALIGCVVIFRDITKEKEIDKAKSEFISVASHQLKTPMTIVNLYTEMLLGESGGPITLRQKEYLKEIQNANVRMVDLVNTLLNVSRIEMGIFSAPPLPLDVMQVLQLVVRESKSSIQEKQLLVHQKYHQVAHMLAVDQLLLHMIFSNLVSNAIRYTPLGGTIVVK